MKYANNRKEKKKRRGNPRKTDVFWGEKKLLAETKRLPPISSRSQVLQRNHVSFQHSGHLLNAIPPF
jgi:hypothetical protein